MEDWTLSGRVRTIALRLEGIIWAMTSDPCWAWRKGGILSAGWFVHIPECSVFLNAQINNSFLSAFLKKNHSIENSRPCFCCARNCGLGKRLNTVFWCSFSRNRLCSITIYKNLYRYFQDYGGQTEQSRSDWVLREVTDPVPVSAEARGSKFIQFCRPFLIDFTIFWASNSSISYLNKTY